MGYKGKRTMGERVSSTNTVKSTVASKTENKKKYQLIGD